MDPETGRLGTEPEQGKVEHRGTQQLSRAMALRFEDEVGLQPEEGTQDTACALPPLNIATGHGLPERPSRELVKKVLEYIRGGEDEGKGK